MSERRLLIPRAGGPDVLAVEPFAPRPAGPGEVSIAVAAAGVNFADLFCRLGLYRAAPPCPFTPGFEAAGTVVGAGEGVASPRIGDRVLAVARFGAQASRIAVRAGWTHPLPEGWGFEDGAAFPVAYLTAWYGLVHLGRAAPGETVLIRSAAGGVGSAACQLSRDLGARVIGTVGSEAKRAAAAAAGADTVLVSSTPAVWSEIDAATGGKGLDLVFDAVGGRGLRLGYERLRPGGRLITYGFAEMMPRGGRRLWPLLAWKAWRTPRFGALGMTTRNRSVAGFNLVHLFDREALFARALDHLLLLAREGRIRPHVGSVFPVERAAEAHALLQSGTSTGKIVLTF